MAHAIEHCLHVPEWCHTPESDMWIKSYKARKFRMISIRNKLHPLFSSELALKLKILFYFIILGFHLPMIEGYFSCWVPIEFML
jgi:hypothetical protein